MAGARIVKYEEDSVILNEGEINPDMFKIIKGHVEIYAGYKTDKEILLGILSEQACFGELGLLLHKPSIYTAVAYSEVYIMRISDDELEDFIANNHKNIIDIMRNMANRMISMRTQIDMLLKDIDSGRKPDENTLIQVRKSIRGYGMYRSIQEAVRDLQGVDSRAQY
ncbi:MAG: cyclic nucleotide-binding domain-containing protein [Lachnospiraceae bacterium]|nr:cyclic nucleotide-binding domain-containing protein [Lachnospiraceae bacterium]